MKPVLRIRDRIVDLANALSRKSIAKQGAEKESTRERLHYIRSIELCLIFQRIPNVNRGILIEAGSGDCYQAGILARNFDWVVASDIRIVDTMNPPQVICDSVFLPFASSSTDVIFLSNVLEHVGNREVALKELLRVLKSDGLAVITVPSLLWKLTEMISYYLEVAETIVWRESVEEEQSEGQRANRNLCSSQVAGKSILEFLLPKVHGAYARNFEELLSYRNESWLDLFQSVGACDVTRLRLPLYPPSSVFMRKVCRLLTHCGLSSSNCYFIYKRLSVAL